MNQSALEKMYLEDDNGVPDGLENVGDIFEYDIPACQITIDHARDGWDSLEVAINAKLDGTDFVLHCNPFTGKEMSYSLILGKKEVPLQKKEAIAKEWKESYKEVAEQCAMLDQMLLKHDSKEKKFDSEDEELEYKRDVHTLGQNIKWVKFKINEFQDQYGEEMLPYNFKNFRDWIDYWKMCADDGEELVEAPFHYREMPIFIVIF
jgi:hypothetical protein